MGENTDVTGCSSKDERHPLRAMPWWAAPIGALLVAVSITITTV
jgi:hypothetical protein